MGNNEQINRLVWQLKEKYSLFAYDFDKKYDLVQIVEDVYELLIQLKDLSPELASEEAEWLITVARGWDVNDQYKKAWDKWLIMKPLFEDIRNVE